MTTPARIQIVDDDPTLLKLLGILLREEGFDVAAADSGEAALRMIEERRPDLLITDLKMGGMDGLALFEAVRQRYPLLPVIILTAHGTIPDAVQATRRGVFGYLTKPYEQKALLMEIGRALALRVSSADSDGEPWEANIITRSPRMRAVIEEARAVATTDASILIGGDTGTGKELLAQTLHDMSHRRDAPFVAINCGAIPENLLESELFGHVKGAFTGASRDHPGLFREAEGGTVFLDEIGDMPVFLQVKLLRVLQERQVRPVGGARAIPVDVRVVSATHRDLQEAIRQGAFREDLYYRLNVVNLVLPPMAERPEDIPLLAQHFLSTLADKYRKNVTGFAPDAMDVLLGAPWPGNVRQIFNAVEKCVALASTPLIPKSLVERATSRGGDELASFDEARRDFEREYLTRLLKITQGNVSHAARLAKRNRSDFYTLLGRHGLEPGSFKPAN